MAKEILVMDECVFKLDNAAGSLVDLSGDVISVTLTYNVKRGSYTTVDSKTPNRTLDVPYDWQITAEYVKSKDDATGMYTHLNAWLTGTDNLRSVEVFNDDESAGSFKWSGEVAFGSPGNPVTKRGGSGDPETASVTLVGDGNLTYAIVT